MRRVTLVAVLCVAVIMVIFAYGALIRWLGMPDPLERTIVDHPLAQQIDGWSVSHLLFFAVLGLLVPNRHLLFLGIGFGWEVVETVLGQVDVRVSGQRVQLVGDISDKGQVDDAAYWYGKESDIIVNILGYSIGSALTGCACMC